MDQLSEFAQRISQFGVILPIGFVIFMIMIGLNAAAKRLQLPWLQKISHYFAIIAWVCMALVMLGGVVLAVMAFSVIIRGNN